jgi:hypothetical protein
MGGEVKTRYVFPLHLAAFTHSDPMPTKLYRPLGLQELALLWDSGMREFPPRLVQQPIFYPVVNLDYARQIARDWNAPDEKSSFAGFVTQFDVSSTYLSKFELHTAGSAAHREYWIPAREMTQFNKAISGLVSVQDEFFGAGFVGYIPQDHSFKGKNAVEQFAELSKLSDTPELAEEISANRKAVFLNFQFWFKTEPKNLRCQRAQRDSLLAQMLKAWKVSRIEVPLPIH